MTNKVKEWLGIIAFMAAFLAIPAFIIFWAKYSVYDKPIVETHCASSVLLPDYQWHMTRNDTVIVTGNHFCFNESFLNFEADTQTCGPRESLLAWRCVQGAK